MGRLDCGVVLMTLSLLLGCANTSGDIPRVRGALQLEIRYPTAEAVAVTDSVSLWGTTGNGEARLLVNGRSVHVEPNGAFATFVPLPPGNHPMLELEARLGRQAVRRSVPVIRATDAGPRGPLRIQPVAGWVRLRRLPNDTTDPATQARPIFSRWNPGGELAIALPQELRVPTDARTEDALRIPLTTGIAVWVPRVDAESVAAPRVRLRGQALRLVPTTEGTDIRLDLPQAVATHVEVIDNLVRWTLFGIEAIDGAPVVPDSGLVTELTLHHLPGGGITIQALLTERPLGWRVRWQGGQLTLELRRWPTVTDGLRGLVIALDPGHPPGGSMGPTGLREDSVTLAVGRLVAARLLELGARPVLTRADSSPVSLDERLLRAEAANAHLFVSLHVNAPGDGRAPWRVDGTRVFWLDPRVIPIGEALLGAVATAMRQSQEGVIQSNLAVLRATWFPAVLVEATAIVLPVREAYLRSPSGIAAYAKGIVTGLETAVRQRTRSR
jgi:N-acetylmuramoyl-L-alanine amidase